MMDYKKNYNKWLEDDFFDKDIREELSNLTDEKEIEDRFYRDLEFGTGGLRGVMGAGTNRMNIVLGTDPDSDRVGIAVKRSQGEYQLVTGNQVGALLMNFILKNTDLVQYANPAIVKTIVTSELGADIARKQGIHVFSTLTGFKFIGEKITQFEQAKLKDNAEQNYDFLFGYEESYGYLAGTHARDKDAVVSSLLICEMAAEAKAQGRSLLEELQEIYTEFGYYKDALDSFTLKGKDGVEKITSMMSQLRTEGTPFENTKEVIDYGLVLVLLFFLELQLEKEQ